MTNESSGNSDSHERRVWVDQLCDRFEDAWGTPQQFSIESVLQELVAEKHAAALKALLPLELELRAGSDRPATLQEFTQRFPEHRDLVAEVVKTPPPPDSLAGAQTVPPNATPSDDANDPKANGGGLKIPRQLGRYRIIRKLGQGAMGSVFLAHDEQLDRDVALKIPRGDIQRNQELRTRFQREAQAAAALHHPGICPIYDIGAFNGIHFICMAYIEGFSLSRFAVAESGLSEQRIAALILKLAEALVVAHTAGFIHRDLKPANVIVNENDDPVILDFGLARRIDRNEDTRVTQTGTTIGSPAYMSPEQVDGDHDKTDHRTDVYSLGVILYELLTGRIPFEGSMASVLGQIMTKEPEKPSDYRRDLSVRLENICLRMMAKVPEKRHPSMHAVVAALKEYLEKYSGSAATVDVEATSDESSANVDQGARRRQQIEGLMKSGDYGQAEKLLVALSRETADNILEAATWAAGELPKLRKTREEVRAGRQEIYNTAVRLMKAHDYEQAVRLLEEYPFDMRTPKMQDLMEQAEGQLHEIERLRAEIRKARNRADNKELLSLLRQLLEIKPGDRKAKALYEQLTRRSAGPITVLLGNRQPALVKDMSAGIQWLVMVLVVAAVGYPAYQWSKGYFSGSAGQDENSLPGTEQLFAGQWEHVVGDSNRSTLTFRSDGTIHRHDKTAVATWELSGRDLVLRWKNSNAPGGYWIDTLRLNETYDQYTGTTLDGSPVSGRLLVGSVGDSESVNMIDALLTSRSGLSGGWQWNDSSQLSFVGPGITPLSFPVDLPNAYDLTMIFDAGEELERLVLVLPVSGSTVALVLRNDPEEFGGLESVDRKSHVDGPAKLSLQTIPSPGVILRAKVASDENDTSIAVNISGSDVLSWSGKTAQLSLNNQWSHGGGPQVAIGAIHADHESDTAACVVHALSFRPAETEENSQVPAITAAEAADNHTPLADDSPELAREFTGHTDRITCVRFAPNGRIVVSASADKTIRFWDVESGNQILMMPSSGVVEDLHFLESGSQLLAGSRVSSLYDVATGNVLQTFDAKGTVESVTVSPNEQRIATHSRDHHVYVWDRQTGAEIAVIDGSPEGWALGAEFFTDEQLLVTEPKQTVGALLRNVQSSEIERRFPETFNWSGHIVVMPDRNSFLTRTWQGVIRTPVSGGDAIEVFPAKQVCSIGATRDGRHIFGGCLDGVLRFWNVETREQVHQIELGTMGLQWADLSPDERFIVTGGGGTYDNELKRIRTDDDFAIRIWSVPERISGTSSAAVSTSSSRLCVNAEVAVSGDGSSWETAFADLNDALNAARTDGSQVNEIWIAAGTYRPSKTGDRSASFALVDGVNLMGGFSGDESTPLQRPASGATTILSGDLKNNDSKGKEPDDNSFRVVVGTGLQKPIVIDGITVTGAHAVSEKVYSGGGMYLEGTFRLVNVEISNCHAKQHGGGIVAHNDTSLECERCRFLSNSADGDGGGLLFRGRSLSIDTCTFDSNKAHNAGALGVWRGGEKCTISKSRFTKNRAHWGGGVMVARNGSRITDCVFKDNASTDDGAGMALGGRAGRPVSDALIQRCMFQNNVAHGEAGGIIIAASQPPANGTSGRSNLVQCKFLNNKANGGYGGGLAGALKMRFNRGGGVNLINVQFVGNNSNDKEHGAGAICHSRSGQLDLYNCVFTGNRCTTASVLRAEGKSRTTFHYCSFRNNSCETRSAAAVLADGDSTVSIRNSVFSPGIGKITEAMPAASATLIRTICPPGTKGLDVIHDASPFGKKQNTSVELRAGSPGIDGGKRSDFPKDAIDMDGDGDRSESIPLDVFGRPRFVNAEPDLGAVERQ